MTKNPFDFADLSDIAETNPELAKKVANSNQDKIDAVVAMFVAGAAAGATTLTIAQLAVVAIRTSVDLPAAATVRTYIKAAIEQGTLKKVTRQSYALADAEVEADETADEEDVDPLADDLG
ncbi:hypothetical protein HOR19_gp14 [Phage MedPE-SWcel-C56]|uniref:Uncharacterized protein n=1 Tax=Phage MedPE-SWcel-C56 TaxID=1871314 RepID=A0A1B1IY32_9CAUD|nr:hypothetical protein HOR19_gp14 [Phage MedPE-SWcel-C56]ANS06207.1 hypothetical protein [Phage MedPE-SWcel-C56]